MIELQDLKFSPIIKIADSEFSNLQSKSGIYRIYDSNMRLMYIGKTKNIYNRILQHSKKGLVSFHCVYFDYAELNDDVNRDIYETYYINKFKPLLNRDKVYTYQTSYFEYLEKNQKYVKARQDLERCYSEIVENLCL